MSKNIKRQNKINSILKKTREQSVSNNLEIEEKETKKPFNKIINTTETHTTKPLDNLYENQPQRNTFQTVSLKQEDNLNKMEMIDSITEYEFKLAIINFFHKIGYEVNEVTDPKIPGVDLIIKKESKPILVKIVKTNSFLNLKPVKEIISAKGSYRIEKAMIITNKFFANSAKEFADTNGIKLWNRADINILL